MDFYYDVDLGRRQPFGKELSGKLKRKPWRSARGNTYFKMVPSPSRGIGTI